MRPYKGKKTLGGALL